MANNDESECLPSNQIKSIQSTMGSFLYYARVLNYNMLPALNKISSLQAKPTQYIKEQC